MENNLISKKTNQEISFFEPMRIPTVTHNDLVVRKGHDGQPRIGKSASLKRAESTWEAHFGRYTPDRPFEGALAMQIRICFEPKDPSWIGLPKSTAPDADNMLKTIQDAMGRLGWFAKGDQQIAEVHVTKAWASPSGIYVRIVEIAED